MRKPLVEAVRQILVEDGRPAIASRDLHALLRRLYAGGYADRVQVLVRKAEATEEDRYKAVQRLVSGRVVRHDPDFGSRVFQVYDVLEQSAEAVCCTVDPLCYVSHLSAMQVWGLTDRSPAHLVLTRPADPPGGDTPGERHAQPSVEPPPMAAVPRRAFPSRVRGRPVLMHEARHPGSLEATGPLIRVAAIGQTFLDMMARPGWCGGMPHVLEVWEREATSHFEAIVATIDASIPKLPKVRAGYILDEVLGLADGRVLAWRSLAQRGSSQKLDPEKPYAPTYSEAWMLSLNA